MKYDPKYTCGFCDYKGRYKYDYDRHCETMLHRKRKWRIEHEQKTNERKEKKKNEMKKKNKNNKKKKKKNKNKFDCPASKYNRHCQTHKHIKAMNGG